MNQRFGKLRVREYLINYRKKNRNGGVTVASKWRCECDCGNEVLVSTSDLVGRQRHLKTSCGCEHKNRRHGLLVGCKSGAKPPTEYTIFCNAKQRCRNPRNPAYKDYGGRGIEFRFKDFPEFFACVGPRPSINHSLDRYPDNDGHYEPGNVRWATAKQQAANQRKKKRARVIKCPHCQQIIENAARLYNSEFTYYCDLEPTA